MPAKDPKTYLWANLCRLTKLADPGVDEMHRAVKKVVGRGTVQRIKEGETSVGVDKLCSLADRFGIEVWQLLAPDGCAPAITPEAQKVAQQFERLNDEQRRSVVALLSVYQPIIGVEQAAAQAAEREPMPAPPASTPLPDGKPRAEPSAKRAR